MRAVVTLSLLLVLGIGCARPKVVVPVPCPPPPTVKRPVLRIHALKASATTAEVLEAYVLDLADYVGYSAQLEAYLNAYRHKKEPSK